MATKRKKINGKWYHLPAGVRYEKRAAGYRIIVTWQERGRRKTKQFADTEEGIKDAIQYSEMIRKDIRMYGVQFGTVSDDEKRAVDRWRQYRDACVKAGCEYKSMEDVVKEALRTLQEESISPTLHEAARMYLQDMGRRNGGEWTPHMITVENRLRHITNELGEVRMCNLTNELIEKFLQGLQNPHTGKTAKAATVKQYLGLFKSMGLLMEKRGLLDKRNNFAQTIDAPKIKRIEPETLSLNEVCRVFEYLRDNPKEHQFIPVLAVGFFCGPRVAERCRLHYRDIFVGGRDVVYLSCEITKTNRDRHTYTNANFRAWMDFAREHGVKMEADSYLLPGGTEEKRKTYHNRLLKRIAEATGIAFPKNCIRHTAATNMTELQGFTSTANQLGHGEGMLANNYRIAITRDEATAYFNISPTCCDADKLLSQAREQ